MAFTVYENKEAGAARVKVDRRLYLSTAGKLVEADDPEAATLYASAGKEVLRAEFEKLGGKVKAAPKAKPEPEPQQEPEPKPKSKPKPKPKAKPKAKAKPKKKGK